MWDKPQLMLGLANLLYALTALLLIYALLFLIVHLPIFPLSHIQVNGQLKHVTRQQIELIVNRELSGNFFTLNLDRARAAFEKLPWVRSVSVRRRWPDALEISMEEHEVLARWGNMGLVSNRGEMFFAASNRVLPVFVGPANSIKEITQYYLQFKQQLEPVGLIPTQLVLNPRLAWQLRLNSGMLIELGRHQVELRLAKFAAAYGRTLGRIKAPITYVDLRYPNGFAVRLPEGVKPPQPKKKAVAVSAPAKPADNKAKTVDKPKAPLPAKPRAADAQPKNENKVNGATAKPEENALPPERGE